MMEAVTKRFKVVIHYKVDCREGGRAVSTEVLGDEILRMDIVTSGQHLAPGSLERL